MKRITALLVTICLWVSTLGTPLLVVGTSAMVLTTTACSAKGFAQTFINAAQAIYAADPTASYAKDLEIAVNAMQLAVNNWNGTSMNCDFIVAANAASAIIDGIAPNSQLALIATIAVAGFDVVMGAILPCTPASIGARFRVPASHTSFRGTAQYNIAHAKIGGAHFESTRMSTFRSQFNDAALASGVNAQI
jgi:hypothetical protein